MEWTEERIEAVRQMAEKNLSARMIANEFGVSRSAVTGIGNRHNIQFHGANGRHTGNGKKPSAPRAQRQVKPKSVHVNPPVIIQPIEELPRMVTLMELAIDACKWPMGDPLNEDFRYCGAKQLPGLPYCSGHCRLAYETPQQRVHAGTGMRWRTSNVPFC